MKITVTDAGKRFNRDWVFRHLSYEFNTGHAYAITGPNGSGKSTLLQVIAGSVMASEGKITYESERLLAPETFYQHLSIAAPYLELIEEMNLREFLQFHCIFKPLLPSLSVEKAIDRCGLRHAADKQIRYYSSGMKQRVKLAQAFFSDTPVLLLDEPCTNLDEEGIALYHLLMSDYSLDRIVIVSSNDKQEYGFCEKIIDMKSYKH